MRNVKYFNFVNMPWLTKEERNLITSTWGVEEYTENEIENEEDERYGELMQIRYFD